MIPEIGQHVKCFFRNGASVEGIVDIWDVNTAKLRSFDGKSVLIISHPSEDIMMIKIVLEIKSEYEYEEELPTISEAIQTQIELQFDGSPPATDEVIDPYSSNYNKNLVELRKDLAVQERRIIAEKLKEHRPTIGATKVQYEYPGPNKKPSPK